MMESNNGLHMQVCCGHTKATRCRGIFASALAGVLVFSCTSVVAGVDTTASFIDNTWTGKGSDKTDMVDVGNWKTSWISGNDDWKVGFRSFASGTYHLSRDVEISSFRMDDAEREIVFDLGSERTLTLLGSAGIAFRLRTGTDKQATGSTFRLASGTIKQPAYDSSLYNYTYELGKKDYCNMQLPEKESHHDSVFIVDGPSSRLETSDFRMRCGTNIWLVVTNGAQVVGNVGLTYSKRTGAGCGVRVAGRESVFTPTGESVDSTGTYKLQTGGTAESFALEFLDGASPWDGVKGFQVGGSGRGASLAFRGSATVFNHTASWPLHVGWNDNGFNRLEITDGAVVTVGYPDVEKPCLTFMPGSEDTPHKYEYIVTDVTSPSTDAFTWEAWFKASDLTTATAENRIVGQPGWLWSENGRLVLEIRNTNGQTGGEPKLAAFYYNGDNRRLCGTTTITDGWHHAALTRSGTTITLYLDGVQEATTNDYVNATPSGADAPFIIAPAFKGSLAEIRLWGAARTQKEIAAAMSYRLSGNETNLVGCWPMSEGSGMPTNIVTGISATESVSSMGYTIGYNQGNGTFSWLNETFTLMDGDSTYGRLWLGAGSGGGLNSVSNVVYVSGEGTRLVCKSKSTNPVGSRSRGNLLHIANNATVETFGDLRVGGAGSLNPASEDGNSDNAVIVESGAHLRVPVIDVGYGIESNPSLRDSLTVRSGASFDTDTFNIGSRTAYEEYASAIFTGEGTISTCANHLTLGKKSGYALFAVDDGADVRFGGRFYVGNNGDVSPGTNSVVVAGGGRLAVGLGVAFYGDSDTLAISNGTFEAQDFHIPYSNVAAGNTRVLIAGADSQIKSTGAAGAGINFRSGTTINVEVPKGGFSRPVLSSPTSITMFSGVNITVTLAQEFGGKYFKCVFAEAPTIDISDDVWASMKASLPDGVKLRQTGTAGSAQKIVLSYGENGMCIILR